MRCKMLVPSPPNRCDYLATVLFQLSSKSIDISERLSYSQGDLKTLRRLSVETQRDARTLKVFKDRGTGARGRRSGTS